MKREVDTLVIGAGPTGLAVAYSLQGRTLVVERSDEVGGLCRSIHKDGAVFDIGGHSFHTPHPEVHALVNELLSGGMYEQQRNAQVFTHDTLIPYPFQKFYDRIPDPDVVRECDEGLREAAQNSGTPANFEEFIVQKFGQGVARHFMLPYNRKLWARDLRQVSCEWTAQRVAGAKGDTDRFDTKGGVRKPLQPSTVVGYPSDGGFEEIYKAFVPHLPGLELNTAITRIDPGTKTATTRDGRTYGWNTLVSTMPLPILLRMVTGLSPELIALGDQLEYLSIHVELLLTNRPLTTSIQRIYVPDPAILPHKIAINHNSSDALRARPRHAIMAEVSHSEKKQVDLAAVAGQTTDLLCRLGILDTPDDIAWHGQVDATYGYPVYTPSRPELVHRLKTALTPLGIHTVGRFGEWEYINSDRCVHKGLQLGQQLRHDREAGCEPRVSARAQVDG